ncbi:Oxysterol-binding protein-related protein 1 [Eumeta japonica]|uniref:Oxysterol-binding protein-related protein 1 n=1 Tax=Eumeta variegata TaxID=151549 RepID=A0A4C1VJC4_EUMVA|nr:Oxysterol-binding protein-related protein 1 [Eumeta japonica]
MNTDVKDTASLEAQESLLYSARHGELQVVKALLHARKEGQLTLDINCKGCSKSNLGWTPLMLATYFGHKDVVEVLLEAGVNTDEVNDLGDTALHKASFIGNEELVLLLLKYNADIHIMNGEGRLARDVCKTRDIHRLLVAAEQSEKRESERRLLTAAKDGSVEEVNEILNSSHPPSINSVDAAGNTCLHRAAYRGHAHLAVLLLQNGIDTTLRNNNGQLAIDLAKDEEMRDVLSVRPVQRLQRTAVRFEGQLLRRSRFLGWRLVWAVLQRGVLLYYASRAEAARAGGRWRARKYLDGAKVVTPVTEPALLVLHYSDGDVHRLAVPRCEKPEIIRQQWVTALNEHISYSGHYLWAGGCTEAKETEDPEECKPLGSMQDALTAAANSLALLDTQLKECNAIVTALEKSCTVGNALHQSACMRFQHACGTGGEALAALRHTAALIAQARDADAAKLQQEIERNRVLEEALAALARTHHALEMSVAEELSNKKSKKKKTTPQPVSNENFFDMFEDSDSDTLVTAGALSPWGGSPESPRRTPVGSLDGDITPTNEHEEYHTVLSCSHSAISSSGSLHTALSPDSVCSPHTPLSPPRFFHPFMKHPPRHRPRKIRELSESESSDELEADKISCLSEDAGRDVTEDDKCIESADEVNKVVRIPYLAINLYEKSHSKRTPYASPVADDGAMFAALGRTRGMIVRGWMWGGSELARIGRTTSETPTAAERCCRTRPRA